MLDCRPVLACSTFLTLLLSCSRPEVHIHDRHGLSYPLVADYAQAHRGTTLVLLDYHHDVAPYADGLRSANWIAALVGSGLVDEVLWVSGRDLLLPNRNARSRWLERGLARFSPSEAQELAARVKLVDWDELESAHLRGPVVVSLDLDLLCHDPGDPPERFLDEIVGWLGRQRPALLTVALSAAYQSDSSSAWSRLGRFARTYPRNGARWFLEAGDLDPVAEGEEELAAWRRWDREYAAAGADSVFLPGAWVWGRAPGEIERILLDRGVEGGDAAAEDVVSGWRDPDRRALIDAFPRAETDAILGAAAAAVKAAWAGTDADEPPAGPDRLGVALRIIGPEGDRGCLALYDGVRDPERAAAFCAQGAARDHRYPPVSPSERDGLSLELSVFGPWSDMAAPTEFRPGIDSVLLVDGNFVALLQAPVAAERHYDRRTFLSRLSIKAGLGPDGWKREGLRFKRAATIAARRPLSAY